MRILLTMLLISYTTHPYPLELTAGYTNHPTINETTKTTGLNPNDTITPIPKPSVTALDGATIIATNQEKPTQRITIRMGPLNAGSTKAMVKILPDSVSFVGVTGRYQIEETAKAATTPPVVPTTPLATPQLQRSDGGTPPIPPAPNVPTQQLVPTTKS